MILVICLNPALQRMLWFETIHAGEVNRAARVLIGLGGKGLNVARVLTQLGADCRVLLPLGGDTGRVCQKILAEEKIAFDSFETSCATRICTTLTHDLTQTELVEEGGPVSGPEYAQIRAWYEKNLADADLVIISGSAPTGIPDDFYFQMIDLAGRRGLRCIIDAQKQALLQGLAARPWLAKPNMKELVAAMSLAGSEGLSIRDRLSWLLAQGAEQALVTDGRKGAFYYHGDQVRRFYGPELVVVNAIGSGDALCAGLAQDYLKNKNMFQAIKFGTACAMSNVLTPVSGSIEIEMVQELIEKIKVESI